MTSLDGSKLSGLNRYSSGPPPPCAVKVCENDWPAVAVRTIGASSVDGSAHVTGVDASGAGCSAAADVVVAGSAAGVVVATGVGVGVVSGVAGQCNGYYAYRLDTDSARAFLGNYVALP